MGTTDPGQLAYSHGFMYPVVAAWLAHLSGVSILDLQRDLLPVVGIVSPVIISLVLFRALLGDWIQASLAGLMLYLQTDFLFVTLRGSHEKVTWPLIMLALLLFFRSVVLHQDLRQFSKHVALFYLTTFALTTTNFFFASTFIVAISIGLILGMGITRYRNHSGSRSSSIQRLLLVSVAGSIIIYLFIFYLYPPANDVLRLLRGINERIAALLFGFEIQAAPYEYISLGWTSTWIWLGLTLFTWVLLLVSFIEWLREGIGLLRAKRLHLPESLTWLLYAGFASQIVVAAILDLAGLFAANTQIRIVPGFAIFAAALAARGLSRFLQGLRHRNGRRLVVVGIALIIAWSSAASLFKITNEPFVSNKWGFYSPAEEFAIRWASDYVQSGEIWTGLDERLCNVYAVVRESEPSVGTICDAYTPDPQVRYFLISEIGEFRHSRLDLPLPATSNEYLIYDNSEVQVYHKQPLTPYQR
jgi:hypothetical protein